MPLIPGSLNPNDADLLTYVLPAGYQVAGMGGIQNGDTVVLFGLVGIMAARCT